LPVHSLVTDGQRDLIGGVGSTPCWPLVCIAARLDNGAKPNRPAAPPASADHHDRVLSANPRDPQGSCLDFHFAVQAFGDVDGEPLDGLAATIGRRR